MLVIFVTCGSQQEAQKISAGLVENRLAACVSMTKVESLFRWQGRTERENEFLLIIKTLKDRFGDVEKFVKANHSYDCPEIIAVDVSSASSDYRSWVSSTCLAPGKT